MVYNTILAESLYRTMVASYTVDVYNVSRKINVVQSHMASYNIDKASTLYDFTLYNIDTVRGTTVLCNQGQTNVEPTPAEFV